MIACMACLAFGLALGLRWIYLLHVAWLYHVASRVVDFECEGPDEVQCRGLVGQTGLFGLDV